MHPHEIARTSGWLSAQPTAFQKDFLSRCLIRKFQKDQSICNVGDPYTGVFGLVDGSIKLELPLQDDFRMAASKQPVCWFGQAACFRRTSFLVSITAASPSTLLYLPYSDFERLVENAAYCRSFALLTVDHYEEAIQALAPLLVNDAHSKVVIRLAQLAIQSGNSRPAVLNISHSDLAEMSGVGRATVFKIASRLEESGLIKQNYRKISISDPEALLNLTRPSST